MKKETLEKLISKFQNKIAELSIFQLIRKCSWGKYLPFHVVHLTSLVLQQGICWLPPSIDLLAVSDS